LYLQSESVSLQINWSPKDIALELWGFSGHFNSCFISRNQNIKLRFR
jgi:hypothetical protein